VPPTAAFSANVTSGEAPLSVQFADTSVVGSFPIILRRWDFDNDGTVDSNARDASFTYTIADTYTVKLTVSDGAREDLETKVDYIKVSAPPGLLVYPGDTDNNGVVNQEDVMPLGRFWNATGPSRPNASMRFDGQRVMPWSPEASTYADATGDGVVNQLDVFPIGLNWGLTHSSGARHVDTSPVEVTSSRSANASLQISVKGALQAGTECWIELHALDAVNLFGLCFELNSFPATAVEFLLAEPGKDIGDDVLCFYHADKNAGAISVGITRKAGQGGSPGKGMMARINMRLAESLADGQHIDLSLQKLLAVDANNVRMILTVEKQILVVGATQPATPAAFDLAQNYPNPFNPETKIEYSLPKASRVRLEIFGLLGQRIKTLVDGQQPAGFHSLIWGGRDDDGRLLTSGVYVYRLTAEGFEKNRKLLLLK
jgi:PKD repeat protein